MKKLTLEIELEYDDEIMHSDEQEAIDWFYNDILTAEPGNLFLHSNEIGDTIGEVTKVKIIEKEARHD